MSSGRVRRADHVRLGPWRTEDGVYVWEGGG